MGSIVKIARTDAFYRVIIVLVASACIAFLIVAFLPDRRSIATDGQVAFGKSVCGADPSGPADLDVFVDHLGVGPGIGGNLGLGKPQLVVRCFGGSFAGLQPTTRYQLGRPDEIPRLPADVVEAIAARKTLDSDLNHLERERRKNAEKACAPNPLIRVRSSSGDDTYFADCGIVGKPNVVLRSVTMADPNS